MNSRTPQRSIAGLAALVALLLLPFSGSATAETSQEERDRMFEETMNGAQLLGQFTIDGMNIPIQPESYSVSKVEKLDDGRWLFVATMKYLENEISLPMPFKVVWSGDTPVITLTDEPIEGMEGSFSARVLIYDGLYAGTWKHDAFGGHMWGKVVKPGVQEGDPEKDGD
ncbi:MAG: hypothetical protein VYE73_11575 [Acidobacteriota bacterium]|nr:hypothetical protein [Acidobacteriota bacterium]